MALRPLRESDVEAVVALQGEGAAVALGRIFPQETHPFPYGEIRDSWRREIADDGTDCFAILDPHGTLAGFAATRGDQFLHFGTALGTWGTGLAGEAHDAVLDHLRAQGHERAWLRCFEENHRAVRFYTRRGWLPTDEVTRTDFPPHPLLRRFELVLTGSGIGNGC